MKKFFRKIIDTISEPFAAFVVLLDESRRINEDGIWNKYWEKKNRKDLKK